LVSSEASDPFMMDLVVGVIVTGFCGRYDGDALV